MTDIFTVIFTSEYDGLAESIPWMLSFDDLDRAKSHVIEEAAKRRTDEESPDPEVQWEDFEEHSTFVQRYDPMTFDVWTIVRTELVDADPSGTISGM